jgi:hypothetical protein
MADEKTAEAVDIVARDLVASVVDAEIGTQWENYPDIGEHDWEAVDKRAMEIIDNLRPAKNGYEAAYEYLERRAEQWMKEDGKAAEHQSR